MGSQHHFLSIGLLNTVDRRMGVGMCGLESCEDEEEEEEEEEEGCHMVRGCWVLGVEVRRGLRWDCYV
jgi:uncharacterized ferredoxin-like protein